NICISRYFFYFYFTMKRQLSIILLTVFHLISFSQNTKSMPHNVNYDHEQYEASSHNWDIEQDRNGIMYFSNEEELVTFDGSYWKIYQLPNKTIVRSIEIGNDHKLYAGGQGEFGYFSPNEQGQLIFKSLKEKVPEKYRSFADIWNIESVGKAIYFRTE